MPKIRQLNEIDITPERYLKACSPDELKELDILLSSPYYLRLMRETEKQEHSKQILP